MGFSQHRLCHQTTCYQNNVLRLLPLCLYISPTDSAMPDPVQDVDASSPFRRGRRGAHHHLEEGRPRGANDSAIEATEVRSPDSLLANSICPFNQYLNFPPSP